VASLGKGRRWLFLVQFSNDHLDKYHHLMTCIKYTLSYETDLYTRLINHEKRGCENVSESLHRLMITTYKHCVFFVYMIVHLIYLCFLMRLIF